MSAAVPSGCDRALDAHRVRLAVEARFPELAPVRAEWFAEGGDSEVYRVNGEWLFRFPKRREVVPSLGPEVRLLPLIADALSVSAPRFRWIAGPGPHFPYPYVGYRPVPGISGDTLPAAALPASESRIAAQLGRALAELHSIDVDQARTLGAEEHPFDPRGRLARAREVAPGLAFVLPPDRLGAYVALLEGAAAPPPASPLLRFTHGDLVAEHLLFDPATLYLTGLIDFADLGLRDPAYDFVGLFHWRGEAFVRMVLDAYAVEPDAGLLDRVRYDAVVASGIWLAEAVAGGSQAEVERHLRCFDHAIMPALDRLLGAR